MDPLNDSLLNINRRGLLKGAGAGGLGLLGGPALGQLLASEKVGSHFPAKAKRVIYLFQSGGPAQMDLFDYKPHLAERFGEEVPKSVYPDERKTTMTSGQKSFPVAPSTMKFSRHGQSGIWLSVMPKVPPHA